MSKSVAARRATKAFAYTAFSTLTHTVDHHQTSEMIQTIFSEAAHRSAYRLLNFVNEYQLVLQRHDIGRLPANVTIEQHLDEIPALVSEQQIAQTLAIAQQPSVLFCCQADRLLIADTNGASLLHAKSQGADVRVIYSATDAVHFAQRYPDKQVVYLAAGFESQSVATLHAMLLAQEKKLTNYFVLCQHRLLAPVLERLYVMHSARCLPIAGVIVPASTIWDKKQTAYHQFQRKYGIPLVMCHGYPFAVIRAIQSVLQQINQADVAQGSHDLFESDVLEGYLQQAFVLRSEQSLLQPGLKLAPAYASLDAEERFANLAQKPPYPSSYNAHSLTA